jgi:hypothetical protein
MSTLFQFRNSNPPASVFDASTIDGELLVYTRGHSGQKFHALVKRYRKYGATDRQITDAMTNARSLSSAIRLGGGR